MIGATSGTGTAYLSGASEFLVMFVLLNLLFCMSCFVDHCFSPGLYDTDHLLFYLLLFFLFIYR
jgi:hypothetical protein